MNIGAYKIKDITTVEEKNYHISQTTDRCTG